MLTRAVDDHRSADPVVLDRVGKKVDQNLLHPRPVGLDEAGAFELGKGHADAALLRLRLDHGLAFVHDFGQRDRFQRQRQLAGLDQREIEDFVDQLQQIPSGLENLVDAALLRRRRRRRTGFHELGETEDRAERRAQLMAHAGEEIRFGEVGLFRHDLALSSSTFFSCSTWSRRLRSVTSRAAANTPCSLRSRS